MGRNTPPPHTPERHHDVLVPVGFFNCLCNCNTRPIGSVNIGMGVSGGGVGCCDCSEFFTLWLCVGFIDIIVSPSFELFSDIVEVTRMSCDSVPASPVNWGSILQQNKQKWKDQCKGKENSCLLNLGWPSYSHQCKRHDHPSYSTVSVEEPPVYRPLPAGGGGGGGGASQLAQLEPCQNQTHPTAVPDSYQTHPTAVPDSYQTHPTAVPDSYQTHPTAVPDSYQTHPTAVPMAGCCLHL